MDLALSELGGKVGEHNRSVSLKVCTFAIQPRIALTRQFSCLHLLNLGIRGLSYHDWLFPLLISQVKRFSFSFYFYFYFIETRSH